MIKFDVSLGQLAVFCQGEVIGDASQRVTGVCSVEAPIDKHLAFVNQPQFCSLIDGGNGCYYIVKPDWQDKVSHGICHDNPMQAYRLILDAILATQNTAPAHGATTIATAKIAATAQIASDASIGQDCVIGHHVVIEPGVVIGDYCRIGHHSVITSGCQLGADCVIENQVTITGKTQMGRACQIGSGAVIGSSGFGFSFEGGQWHPIAQIGRVKIGERVFVGANSCIDRGAIHDTIIGDNVIIDNLVHIAHNVEVGDHTAMAAFVGVAGSTKIGKYCLLGGKVGVAGHIHIADGVQINGGSNILQSIEKSGRYSGVLPTLPATRWNRLAIYFTKLDELTKRIKSMRKENE